MPPTLVAPGTPARTELLEYLRQMYEIRFFEQAVYDLLMRGLLKGTVHLYAGEEAVAVGALAPLTEGDLITSTHRGHGHCLVHGVRLARTPEARQAHLNAMMAEVATRETGYSRGRGGSMHIADVAHGNLGATGIVGGNLPVATGAGLALQLKRTGGAVLCFFGDGAANNGVFHEALNMAAVWNLPVVYICENNLYAMSLPWRKASKVADVAARAAGYGMEGQVVDGMDVLAVREAVAAALERARAGQGPTLVECKTYRFYGHSRSDPRVYRTREEEQAWQQRDPIAAYRRQLLESGVALAAELDAVEAEARASIACAVEFALASPEPDPAELYAGLYAPARTTEVEVQTEKALSEQVRAGRITREISYAQAIAEALSEEMERDPRVFLMGEDIGPYGGPYGVTRGLVDRFGAERVRDTPISEAAIVGAGVGAAMAGMRPVGELMYVDFTLLVGDQLVNQGAKTRYMFGGRSTVPLVIRTQGGSGRSIAAQHSQSLEALWTHFPGLHVVMPATPYDAKGLLKASIRDDNLVLFIEHKMLYTTTGPAPEEDYIIPLGVADVKRAGRDVSIITYSRMVLRALEAAEALAGEGIEAEVVDLRTLKPLDADTVLESVRKTGRAVVVYEGYRTGGFGAELAALIGEQAFAELKAPVRRVASADVPVPASPVLEQAACPQTADIAAAVRQVLDWPRRNSEL